MRKYLFFLATLVSLATINAQESTYGITSGINFSTVTTDGSSLIVNAQDDFVTTFNFGAYLDHAINEKLGVKFDVNYVNREIPTFNTSVLQNIQLKSLDITPLLKVSLGENYNQGFSFLFGPRASILLSAEGNGTDAKDAFKSTTFGLQGGMLQTINDYLAFELKVDYGFSVSDEDATGNNINIVSVFISLNVNLKSLLGK
jgi:hypothetical protein